MLEFHSPMRPFILCRISVLCGLIAWLGLRAAHADDPVLLKLAFVSNREHYWYPHLYLYEHDGDATGKIVGAINPQDKRLDHQPVLSDDGKLCVFGFEREAEVGRIQLWDLTTNAPRDFGDLFKTPNAVFSPSLSANGRLLSLSAWNRPGSSARWDVLLYDLVDKRPIDLPGLNSSKHDERRGAISGDGRWLAFTSNAPDGRGLTDLRLYDRQSSQVMPLPEMNSTATDSYPSLTHDGRLLCFASDRDGGLGGLDIYLYDCADQRFIPLAGLNSPGHEQSPSISRDGRWIAFVSERFGSAGEHDVFIYDRDRGRLVPTPGLNTDRDDYDPNIVVRIP